MKTKFYLNLKSWLLMMLMLIGAGGNLWAEEVTGTITFGSNDVKINDASVTGDDNQGNTWTITTEGTTSFTSDSDYYQVGSSKKPATSITFTTTLPSDVNITFMSAKFGGFSGTAGTVALKVGDTSVGTGSLNGTNDVTVSSSTEATGKVLTVTVTGISKGVKVYNISYKYSTTSGPVTPTVLFESGHKYVEIGKTATNVISKPNDLVVTYSSDNTNIADVDAETGTVTGKAKGTANITASWDAVENKYNEGSVSYKVAVTGSTFSFMQSSTKEGTLTNAPSGVTATFTTTYSDKNQLTDGNSMTLTLKNIPSNYKIEGVILNVHNNASSGNGTATILVNGKEIGSLGINGLGKNYQKKSIEITPTFVSGDVVITISATENSVYCNSFEIEYSIVNIEALSADELMGSVSIEGNVITATPAEGYRISKTTPYTVSGTAEVAQEGNVFTVAPTSDCTVTINFEAIPTHTVTWSINGETSEETFAEGAALTHETPADIEGKTFVGWTTTPITGEVETATLVAPVMGNADVTYYAVYANVTPGTATTFTDVLNRETTGVTGTSYTGWSGKTATSNAVYAGQSAGGNDAIQLRSDKTPHSGVISTTSGGKLAKVVVEWNSETANGRTLDIYGSNTAYDAADDLYDSSKQGAKLGSIVKGTSTELTITGDYQYIGLRSASGAMYLTSVSITWETGTPATYSGYCTTVSKPVIARVTHCSGLDENGEEVWSSTNCATAEEVEQHVSLTICDDFSSDEWYADRIWVYGEVNANLTLGKNQYVYISELGENANFTGKVTAAEGYIIVAKDVKDDFDYNYEREHKSATLYTVRRHPDYAKIKIVKADGTAFGYDKLFATGQYSTMKLDDGDVMILQDDVDYAENTAWYPFVNLTIDLNGHTLTNSKGSALGLSPQKTLTIIDSSEEKTGTVSVGDNITKSPTIKADRQDAKLIINGGNVIAPDNSNKGALIAGDNTEVTINGGNFQGALSIAANSAATIKIKGGIFNQPVPEEFCAEGFIPTDLGEGKYSVKAGQYVAQVGDVKYETFAEAIAALTEENNTVTLLADIAEAYTLAEAQSLDVNLNGHTLNVVAPAGNILKTAEADGVTTYSYVAPVAKIGEALYETLQAAFNAANEGETVTLLKDYVANEAMAGGTRQFVINKSITFDGGGYTLTTKNRGIGIGNVNGDVTENIDVTIKNVTVLNTASGARCIDTRGKIGSLTLEGVTLNTQGAPSGYTQPLTIGGNQSDVANVTITNSTIQTNDAATAYYAIITFNPVNMTVTNSTIKGWANIYAKKADGSCAGSAGSVFNFDKCTLKSSNAYSNTSNAFSAFMIEDNNVTIKVTNSDIVITNSGDQWQTIAGYPMNNALSGNKVTLGEGNKVKFVEPGQFAFVINQSEGSEFTVTGGLFSTVVPDEFCAEGLTTVANTDETTKDEYPYAVGVKVEVAAPIIFHDGGEYEGKLTVAMAGEGVKYTLNGGAEQTYSAPFTISETTTVKAWAEKDGIKSDVVEKTFTIVAKQAGAEVADGYYNIKTNDGKFVNVAGRKTVTLVSDTEGKAGTVIRVNADAEGVKVLRSQGVDLPGYAKKAMNYVPEIVQLAVDKLHAEGAGELLGETGLEKIMDKFNESFDYNLYLEKDGEAYRIYGRTPSMKPVVDFYAENKANVDAKLPELEEFINKAIQKVLEKTNGSGASVLVPFSLQTIWERMDSTLTNPADDEAKFYEEVLSSEANVWNFAYQTAMLYWGNLKNHPRFAEIQGKLGDYSKYIDKVENIRPNFKYYIVPSESGVDFISEGNVAIKDASTAWTMESVREFKVNFETEQAFNIYPTTSGGKTIEAKEYYTTLYTDFAYTLPKGVKAYKVSEITKKYSVAKREEITGVIPAQTPVLLVTSNEGAQKLTLTTEAGTAVTDNLLVGADALINEYQIKTPQVVSLFDMAKSILGESAYETYLKKYEHLMLKNAGTVGNKYFFGLTADDLKGVTNLRVLTLDNAGMNPGFHDIWEKVDANKAVILTNDYNPVKLFLVGDVNRDGNISIADVTALVNIILGKATYPEDNDKYDFAAANVNNDKAITISDVTALVNIILGK